MTTTDQEEKKAKRKAYCKAWREANKGYSTEYAKKKRVDDPKVREINNQKHRDWYARNKDTPELKARKAEIRAKNKQKAIDNPEIKRKARGHRLKKTYWPDLTWEQALEEYDRLLEEQEHRCKICKVHKENFKQNLHVDHDHATGRVRGLLCSVCNRNLVGGIDLRSKAKKVELSKHDLAKSLADYFEERHD